MREMLPVMRHLLHTMRIFAVTEDRNMNAMATHWDIAQQPQKEEEMFMIAKPSTRRVYFVGPSSTGKTTMVNAMAKLYPQAVIHKELARNIMKKHNITLQDLKVDVSTVAWLQGEIIRQHAKLMAGQWCNLSRYSELEFTIVVRSTHSPSANNVSGKMRTKISLSLQRCRIFFQRIKI